MNREEILKRLKNKAFLAALVGGLYQLLHKYGYAPDLGTWQLWIDLASYALLGWGVYSTFDQKTNENK
jgi:hypothetical protein